MDNNAIPLEQHQKAIDTMREEFEETLEEGFEEAYSMLKESQEELRAERQKAEIYQAIARMERISFFETLSHLKNDFRDLLQKLYSVADNIGGVKKTKAYKSPKSVIKKEQARIQVANENAVDDLRPEYDLKSLKKAPLGVYRKQKFTEGHCPVTQWDGMGHGPDVDYSWMGSSSHPVRDEDLRRAKNDLSMGAGFSQQINIKEEADGKEER